MGIRKNTIKIKTALISLSDKSNLRPLLNLLIKYKTQATVAICVLFMIGIYFAGRASVSCPPKSKVCESEIKTNTKLFAEIENEGILPEHNTVIIDEAHNLVRSAYEQFKIEWSEKGIHLLLQKIDPSHPRSMRWNQIIQKNIRSGCSSS